MGNDGGSIPTRRELVKSAARAPTVSELKATAHESLTHAWTHDPLTSDPLDPDNIVADWRGRLYNYETILRGLMPSGVGEREETEVDESNTFASTGIKSLRDVVKLQRFEPPREKKKDRRDDVSSTGWTCPLSMKELGPSTKAVYLIPCGHVYAESAIKEVGALDREDPEAILCCPECAAKIRPENIIPILATETRELKKLLARIEALREKGLTHSLKKDKSARKKGQKKKDNQKRKAGDCDEDGEPAASKEKKATSTDTLKGKENNANCINDIDNPMLACLTAKVLAEQEVRNKRRKLAAAP